MSRSEAEYLRHIQEEAGYLAEIGRDMKKARFVRDDTLKRAATRSIEIIGEATKQLSGEIARAVPERAVATDGADARPTDPRLLQRGLRHRLERDRE